MVEKKLFSTKSLDALVIISTLSSLILQCYTVEAKKRKREQDQSDWNSGRKKGKRSKGEIKKRQSERAKAK